MTSRLLRQWPCGRKDPQGGQSLKEDEGWHSGSVAGPAVDGLAFEKKKHPLMRQPCGWGSVEHALLESPLRRWPCGRDPL